MHMQRLRRQALMAARTRCSRTILTSDPDHSLVYRLVNVYGKEDALLSLISDPEKVDT
jgi:hypothetical protein